MASSSKIEIDASVDEVYSVLLDLESYPSWLSTIKKVEILEKDNQGRPSKVTLSIDAGMMKDKPTLDYDWSSAPTTISFSLDDADLLTAMDGIYTLKALDSDTTEVTYQLTTAVSMPIPQMMLTKAEEATISLALKELQAKFQ